MADDAIPIPQHPNTPLSQLTISTVADCIVERVTMVLILTGFRVRRRISTGDSTACAGGEGAESMTRKRLGLICLGLLAMLAVVAGYALWAVHQVPDFYEDLVAAEIDPGVRQDEAKRFTQRTLQLVDDVKQAKDWSHEFSQRQVNSWFIEELDGTKGKYADLLPAEATSPRVKIDGDAVLIGFRYTSSQWSGVVSLRVRPWVPEPNKLALEISGVKAGALPLPLDSVLKKIEGQIQSRGWRVEWRQTAGNDVLVIDFSRGDKKRSILKSVQVADGKVRVSGRKPE